MTRSKKQKNDQDSLEEQIKILKSENRHLHRELKKQNKKYKPEHGGKEKLQQEEYDEQNLCQECGKGNIIETDLGPRILTHCTVCDFKRALKKT